MVVVQALQEMRKLRTEKTAEVKEFRLRLEHLKTHKDHSTKLKSDIAEGQEKDRNYMTQINQFEQEVQVSCHQACQPIHLCSVVRSPADFHPFCIAGVVVLASTPSSTSQVTAALQP